MKLNLSDLEFGSPGNFIQQICKLSYLLMAQKICVSMQSAHYMQNHHSFKSDLYF